MGISNHFLPVRLTILLVWGAASNVLFAAAEFKFIKPGKQAYNVHYNDDFEINCTTNDPNATTSLWHLGRLDANIWKQLFQKPGKLIQNVYTVRDFGETDNGQYQCRATDSTGTTIKWDKDTGHINLIDRIIIQESIEIQNPDVSEIDVGKSITLRCTSDILATSLKWVKVLDNGTEVPVSYKSVRRAKKVINLDIIKAKPSHSGLYRCILTYEGRKSKEVRLTVLGYLAPVIKSYSGKSTSAVVVRSPNLITIQCTVEGYPLPAIQWYKNGRAIIASSCSTTWGSSRKYKYCTSVRNIAMPKGVQGNLTILQNSFPEDSGSYTCMANNTQGEAKVQIVVNVLAQPIISNDKHQEIPVALGTTINETCSATGNPLPDVVWTRTNDPNGKVLSRGKGSALLVVKDVQGKDLGNYTCNATNTIKSVIAVFTIKDSNIGLFLRQGTTLNNGMSKTLVTGIISGSVVLIVIVIIICVVLYRRQKRQTQEYKKLYFMRTGNASYVIDHDRSLLDQCNNLPYDLDWEFPEVRLILGEPLGAGTFGQVLKAEAIGMPAFKPRDKTTEAGRLRSKLRKSTGKSKKKDRQINLIKGEETVAVKILQDEASQSDYKDLATELKILIHLGEHKNIVNVLGACTRGRRLMVIIEYAPHGDLLSFLRGKRDIYDPKWLKTLNTPEQEFTLVDLGMTAYQISRGMEFLASKKCVHRDLAARNVLVGVNYVMKISDFGLARDIYQDDLYVKTTSGLLPVKWMALESLFDRVYTEKSDVWSFGIVLWEIFTLGGCPYASVPLERLVEYLNEGNRMQQPSFCPPDIYDIMRDCWRKLPDQRPSFEELKAGIKRIVQKNVPKDNLRVPLEADDPLTKASNEYLLPVDCVPGRRAESEKTPKKSDELLQDAPNSESNGLVASGNSKENDGRFKKGNKGKNYENKPLLYQSSLSSDSGRTYINQHESTV